MDANRRELLLQKEVYAVVGCAIEVLNVRGHGLHEKIYENCLCVSSACVVCPTTNKNGIKCCTRVNRSESMFRILSSNTN